jgi:hypothetical protein
MDSATLDRAVAQNRLRRFCPPEPLPVATPAGGADKPPPATPVKCCLCDDDSDPVRWRIFKFKILAVDHESGRPTTVRKSFSVCPRCNHKLPIGHAAASAILLGHLGEKVEE